MDILERTRLSHPVDKVQAVTEAETILRMQASVREIFVHERVRDYLLRIVHRTRDSVHLTLGASPRASMMFFRACQAFAAVLGRGYVIPDDVKALASPVLEHRLILNPESRLRRVTTRSVLQDVLKEVPVPAGNINWKPS
jgi:MoxR-like ATPase